MTGARISFSTLAIPDDPLATAVSLGGDWGYAGVELRLIDGDLIDPAMLTTRLHWPLQLECWRPAFHGPSGSVLPSAWRPTIRSRLPRL